MPTPRRSILFGLALACLSSVALAGPPSEKPPARGVLVVPEAPLPIDPELRTGELANGLRWVIHPTDDPSAGASLSLIIGAGAIDEPEGAQGAAHLASRLVFSDSASFAPGELESALRRAGIGVNRLENVSNSFDATAYHFDLPSADERGLELVLRMFAELPGGLVFDEATVERERELALRDEKLRRNPIQRLDEQIIPRLFPGTPYATHPPAGTADDLSRVTPASLRAYADASFRTDRMTIVVAGAFEPMLVEHAIEHAFEDIHAPAPVPAETDATAGATPFAGFEAIEHADGCERTEIVLSDPELPYAVVQLIRIVDRPPGEHTTRDLARSVRMDVALEAWRQRLERERCAGLEVERVVSRSGGLSASLTLTTIATLGPADGWREALGAMARQAASALHNGFTPEEIDLAKQAATTMYEDAALDTVGDEPGEIARRIGLRLSHDSSPVSARLRADSAREVLRAIDTASVNEAFRELYDTECLTIFVLLPEGADEPDEGDVRRVFDASVTDAQRPGASPALAGVPAEIPGSLAELHGEIRTIALHPTTGVLSATLANGVRVHHKRMAEMDGHFTLSLTLAGGRLDEDASTRGLTEATGAFWDSPATRDATSCDLRAAFASASIDLASDIGPDSVRVTLTAPTDRAEQAFAIIRTLIDDPVLEDRALKRWQAQMLSRRRFIDAQPRAMLNDVIADAMYPLDDPRHRPLTPDEIRAIDPEEARAWLADLCSGAPIEAAVVGDLGKRQAMDLAARALGSLDARGDIRDRLAEPSRLLVPREHPVSVELDAPTMSPNAVTLIGFRGPGASDVVARLNLDVAMRILGARLDRALKGEASGVALVQASAFANVAYPDFGLAFAMAEVEPARAGETLQDLEHHAAELAFTGPTSEEVDLAKRLALNELKGDRVSPEWWGRTLSTLSYRGLTPDALDEERAALEAIDAQSVRETLETYHDSSRKVVITITPKRPAGGG